MHDYGFSTGALALGDFRKGLEILAGHGATAVELSALREHELQGLMESVPDLDLSSYSYVSVHAPSRFHAFPERECAELLLPCIDLGWPVVLHPDAIGDPAPWDAFGSTLCLENMDKRKLDGRTAGELSRWFDRFPSARFCLDLGHARQVDGSLIETRRLLRCFGDRLAQVHLSELDAMSRHWRLSAGAARAFGEIAHLLPSLAVILESTVPPEQVGFELRMARWALDGRAAMQGRAAAMATP